MLNIGEFARLGRVTPRMLRHYDELGLLDPQRVDSATGYRFYSVGQLGRLHRIVALSVGAKPGISIGVYQDEGGTVPEGDIVLHAGFDIGDQDVPDTDTVEVVELPVVEAAAAAYRGGDDGIVAAWESLVRWIDDSGYRLVGDCRELYLEWHDDDPASNVLELQQPIAR